MKRLGDSVDALWNGEVADPQIKLGSRACSSCQAPIVMLPNYRGRRQAFNAVAVDPSEHSVAEGEHWYPIRGRGVLPGDMLPERATQGRAYLTRHRCVPVQDMMRHSLIEIRHTMGQIRVQDMVLDQMHEYTYRWPSEWAHIIGEIQSVALCNARMPGRRTAARERARLRDMPVCPRCIERLELNKDSRGRAILNALRDKARAEIEAGSVRVDPASMGKFLRRKNTSDAPAHTPECPYIRSSVFVPSEWEGFEHFPRLTSACPLCRPVKSLDEALEDIERARHQAEVAAKVHAEQDRIRLDETARRRAESTAAFAKLGVFVYQPGARNLLVHHHTCPFLMRAKVDRWTGTDSLPQGLEQHFCTTYL